MTYMTTAGIKLRPVQREPRQNRFCGPAVVSALLDVDTAQAARLIRRESGHRQVTGTSYRDLRRTLYRAGVDTEPIPWSLSEAGGLSRHEHYGPEPEPARRPTLAKWLRIMTSWRTRGRVFLLVAGNHWCLVSGRRYVCGITQQIVSIRDTKIKRRSRVSGAWEIIPRGSQRECTPWPSDDPDFRNWSYLASEDAQ